MGQPIPPKYRWLKRMLIAAGILIVSVFGLRLWWGWEANRRLQAEIDRIVAAGEPIYPEDFDSKQEIPDEQNAARLLIKAAEAIDLSPEEQKLLEEFAGEPALVKERLEEVRGIVGGSAEALSLVRRARGMPGADWGVRIRTPALETSLDTLSGQRQLAKVSYLAACLHHADANHHDAMQSVRDILAGSQSLSRQPMLIPQLASWVMAGFALRALETILPEMAIVAEVRAREATRHEVIDSQVRLLITELLDEREMRAGMRQAMMCERMYQVDILKTIMNGQSTMSALFGWWSGPPPVSLPDVVWRHALGPVLTLDVARVLRKTTPFVDAANAGSFVDVPVAEDFDQSRLRFVLHPFGSFLPASIERSFLLYFRLLAWRRVAATALAVRLYELDHGRRPTTLAQLVPDYLSHVPEDPFTEGGHLLRYLPDEEHPVVYSIGDDGIDEGGKAAKWADITFFLDGWQPEDESDEGQAGEKEP